MQVYQNTTSSMGTRFNLLIPGIDKPKGDQMFSSCLHELNHLENMLSCFIPTSEISFLNTQAFKSPVKVSEELFEILDLCLSYYKRTQKTFDISLGNIIDKKAGVFLKEIGSDKILLDFQNKTVQFESAQVKINLGGFGKGYALSNLKDLLIKLGVTSAFISFGESSVCCIGKHPHGDFWPVGIQDFYQRDKSLAALKLVDQSISTSGNLELNDHIVNPINGKAVAAKKMITVKCDSPIDAEVLSTALMVAENDQLKSIINYFPEVEVMKVVYDNQKPKIFRYKSA